MTKVPYSIQYYDSLVDGAVRSARRIVPIVLKAVRPRSVIDVGCGIGAWGSVFLECGVAEVKGVDGGWVDREALLIPEESFLVADLARGLRLNRQFDLVVSLEVAEHLPESSAEAFVDSLVGLGDMVLFSAAIPGQGGEDHVNEQWQGYWAELFGARGYRPVDLLRPFVWDDPDVEFWYAQNTLLYVRESRLSEEPALQESADRPASLSVVHPRKFTETRDSSERGWKKVSEMIDWADELQRRNQAMFEVRPGSLPVGRVLLRAPSLVWHRIREALK